MAQAVGIVRVFIASDDLIDALPQQHQRVMAYPFIISRVAEELDPVAGQMMALVKSPQRQQTSVTGDLASGKITLHGTMVVEGEGNCDIRRVVTFGCSKMVYWVLAKPSAQAPFRASFLFSPQNSTNNPG